MRSGPRRRDRAPSDVADSKLLSLVLRHRPELAGVHLDDAGWVDVEVLLVGLAAAGRPMTRARLEHLVASSDKQRFTLRDERIRAAQGHSVPVELGLPPVAPPPVLFHGTPLRNVGPILRTGLTRRSRHAVHLSGDAATARRVGARRGPAAVLHVAAGAMAADGLVFRRADNGVWLVEAVPPRYLSLLEGTD